VDLHFSVGIAEAMPASRPRTKLQAVWMARDGGQVSWLEGGVARLKKKEGRPLPYGKSPGAPNSTSPGAGSSRFAHTTILREGYSPQESYSCGQKKKAPAPPGASHNMDTRAAPRLPGERVLSVLLKLGLKIQRALSGSGPSRDLRAMVWQKCSSPHRNPVKNAAPGARGQQVGRFAATLPVPLRVGVRCGCQQSAARTIRRVERRDHHLMVATASLFKNGYRR
jgi:hypothetical protein